MAFYSKLLTWSFIGRENQTSPARSTARPKIALLVTASAQNAIFGLRAGVPGVCGRVVERGFLDGRVLRTRVWVMLRGVGLAETCVGSCLGCAPRTRGRNASRRRERFWIDWRSGAARNAILDGVRVWSVRVGVCGKRARFWADGTLRATETEAVRVARGELWTPEVRRPSA